MCTLFKLAILENYYKDIYIETIPEFLNFNIFKKKKNPAIVVFC